MVGLAKSEIDKVQTMLHERKATFAFQQAEIKKKVLVECTKPLRIKQLQSEVATARSEETKKRGMWELAKVRLEKAQKAAEDRQNPAESVRRILALIHRAIPIDAGLDIRSIKTLMQMDVLRCKSPEMVRKEIWAHMLMYNLARGVMAEAAHRAGLQPRVLSSQLRFILAASPFPLMGGRTTE
jgi:hypothetical protein